MHLPNIINEGGIKRSYEGESFTPNKKPRTDEMKEGQAADSAALPQTIPLEIGILVHMMQFLPFKDFLTFRLLSKKTQIEADLSPIWRTFSKRRRINFNWSFLEKRYYPEMEQYLVGKTLFIYIKSKGKLLKNGISSISIQQIQDVYNRFEKRMCLYPVLGGYIWEDLSFLAAIISDPYRYPQPILRTPLVSAFKNDWEKAKEALKTLDVDSSEMAGELLLKGLHSLVGYNDEDQPDARQSLHVASMCLKKAICKGATCAGYLAIKVLSIQKRIYEGNEISPLFCHGLASAAAEADKRPDYSGLELLLKIDSTLFDKLYDEGYQDPPILLAQGMNNYWVNQTMLYFIKTAVLGYLKSDYPFSLSQLLGIAGIYFKNEDWKEAAKYYEQALFLAKEKKKKIPYQTCRKAVTAVCKVEGLKKENWQKVVEYFEEVITLHQKDLDAGKQLRLLYKEIMEISDDVDCDPPLPIILKSARLHIESGCEADLKIAAEHYKKAIECAKEKGETVPYEAYEKAALLSFDEEDWEKAAEYYEQVISLAAEEISYEIYENAAIANSESGNWQKAVDYYEHAIPLAEAEEEGVSGDDLYELYEGAAIANFKSGNWEEAVDYYETVICLEEEEVSYERYGNVAYANFKSGNLQKAAEYYEKAISLKGQVASYEIYEGAASANFGLGNWQKAAGYYDKAIEETIPARCEVYESAAYANLKLENWEKASQYYDKVFILAIKEQKDVSQEICRDANYATRKYQEDFCSKIFND